MHFHSRKMNPENIWHVGKSIRKAIEATKKDSLAEKLSVVWTRKRSKAGSDRLFVITGRTRNPLLKSAQIMDENGQ